MFQIIVNKLPINLHKNETKIFIITFITVLTFKKQNTINKLKVNIL